MCRFFSGYFFRHPLLDGFDYYWRMEPAVSFTCNLDQDPFRYMQVGGSAYAGLGAQGGATWTLWDSCLADRRTMGLLVL